MTTKATFLRRSACPGVALAKPIVLIRFSSPVTAGWLSRMNLRRTRGGSEKLPDGQLGLFNEAEADAADEPAPTTDVSAHRAREWERNSLCPTELFG